MLNVFLKLVQIFKVQLFFVVVEIPASVNCFKTVLQKK